MDAHVECFYSTGDSLLGMAYFLGGQPRLGLGLGSGYVCMGGGAY